MSRRCPTTKLPNGEYPLKIDVKLEAQGLPFSGELKDALPAAWKKSWPTINPSGSCDVDAEVHIAPRQPDHTHIVIVPRPESNVRLEVMRSPQPPLDPGGMIELPMEEVHGRFVFDDGKVTMQDVNFKFRGAPVKFSRGTVFLEDSGRFHLAVYELDVKDIRFDARSAQEDAPLDGPVCPQARRRHTRSGPEATWRSAGRANPACPHGANGRKCWSSSTATRSRPESRWSTFKGSSIR